MDDKDVHGNDGYNQTDSNKEYRGKDITARKKTKQTAAKTAAERSTIRSTAARTAVVMQTGLRWE